MKQLLFVLTLLTGNICLAQTDVQGSQDYGLLPRLPDYHIYNYAELEYDSHGFFIENKKLAKEGQKYTITYRHDKWEEDEFIFPGRLQIMRNYSNAIESAGGHVVFERHNAEYGQYSFINPEQKEVWVEVRPISSGKRYTITVIEKEAMHQDISIDAELIKNKIALEGKIAIYGIYFDVGLSTIKEESEPALEEISAYLKENTEVACWIVGHTDTDGSFELNSALSLARAQAVKERLEKKYDITSDRLFAEGVGPLAPVASNSSEAGKKLNRRVELVRK